ncbi:MAG TPA: glycosyltransferase 87 family protein [Candidatus Dormibacteraeota bacterium]|nr:glycosyltransferase 87 family protein [Candidatus Dormibacteraeota bacterium]
MIPAVSSMRPRERAVLALVITGLLVSLVFYVHGSSGHGDLALYHRYAEDFWLGSPPFTSLPAEYPLLSMVPFTLTLLPDYVTGFGLWMVLLFLAVIEVIRRRESARAAEICAVYLIVGCFATVLGRFDLVPAAATLVAYWAARERRFTLAYAVLAVGTLLKLYPLFLLPVVVLEQYRTLGRDPLRAAPPPQVLGGVGLFAGAVAGVFALSAVLSPDGWLGPITYNTHRPLQVESVPASVLWLSGLMGLPTAPDHSFHSWNLVGQIDGLLGVLSELALVGGCLWIYWRQTSGRLTFGRAMTLCLLVVVCTNKVFSPQYLMWVLPLVAIMDQEYDPVWLAICALTTLIFPYGYQWAHTTGPYSPASYPLWFSALIAVRNALMTAALVRFFRRSGAAGVEMDVLKPSETSAA